MQQVDGAKLSLSVPEQRACYLKKTGGKRKLQFTFKVAVSINGTPTRFVPPVNGPRERAAGLRHYANWRAC